MSIFANLKQSWQEIRQRESEKMKTMTFREKVGYIYDNWSLEILVAIAAVVIIVVAIVWTDNTTDKFILSFGIVDSEISGREMDAIKAENLTFAYDRDEIFSHAEFSLPKGAFAVITGASGIGKSTLLKLLLGVFRPSTGGLYLSGEGYEQPLDRSTRRLFSYVPQGNLLLSGTLRENLTIVRPEATEAEIAEALFVSAMEDYLPQLPKGLDTVLGESGAGLSEGQAQRLAIARAVLGGAPVLLLDECTSALDADTEQKVLQRLKALPNRTFISVTHRPAAVKLCDWRLEVEDGKIRCVQVEQE